MKEVTTISGTEEEWIRKKLSAQKMPPYPPSAKILTLLERAF